MSNSGIYLIRHKGSGKAYVGRSVNIRNRWNLHKRHTEQGRDKSPLHRALRKYGYDAFDWIVLAEAPAHLQVELERQFIKDMGVMVPAGYNVGGAAGGQPSRELLDAMGSDERKQKLAEMRALSLKMHATLAERRKDPEYEAAYRTAKSEAAKKRWAERKARIASDPVFAAEAKAKWDLRAEKAVKTLQTRVATDKNFAEHIKKVRSAGAKKARASDPRTLKSYERQGVAL